jgi:hypothetical protein
LASKKRIGKHPNPYRLVSVLKEELKIAAHQSLSVAAGRPNKKGRKPLYKRLREQKRDLMDRLEEHEIDLLQYQKAIGALTLKMDKRAIAVGRFLSFNYETFQECPIFKLLFM